MPSRIRLALIAVAIVFATFFAGATLAQQADYISSYTWASNVDGVGGISGIEVFGGGNTFMVVGDRGAIVEGEFERDDGRISSVIPNFGTLKNTNDTPLSSLKSDAEGLAIRTDGRIYVSFETFHRVWTYRDPESEAAWIPRHPDFEYMQSNFALEAIAVDSENSLYTIPEQSGDIAKPFPVYRYKNGAWSVPFSILRIGLFSPVGADFGPDGKLYLLERHLGFFGFETRVRRFTVRGDLLENEEVVLTSPSGAHDNLEGIAVWRDAAGDIRLTMVSDNNFNAFQITEFVEYRLQE